MRLVLGRALHELAHILHANITSRSNMNNLPFSKPGRFWKGNLHTHSTRSDGKLHPDRVCQVYREMGYDFLAITDHFLQQYSYPITDTHTYSTADFATLIGAELHAVRPIIDPPATRLDELAGADRRRMTDNRDQIALAARLYPQHAEAIVLVVEGHALDEASQVLARRLSGRRSPHLRSIGLCRPPSGSMSMSSRRSFWSGVSVIIAASKHHSQSHKA
jgi:hypothetical protein